MTYIYAFLFVGVLCLIAQIIIDNTCLSFGHITSLFVVLGTVLAFFDVYDKIKELAVEMGYAGEVKEFKANPGMYKAHVGDVSTVLRVALTARTNTPDMYEIMQVLGKNRIAKRLEVAKENLK